MKIHSIAILSLSAAAIVALPSCNESKTADAAKDVKESVADAKKDMVDATKTTGKELDKTAEAAREEIKEKVDDIKTSDTGSAVVGAEARKLMQASYDATESYAALMESIKDTDTAKAALAKFDDLGKKYEELGKMAKGIDPSATAPEDAMKMQKEMMEKMQPLQKRMQDATMSAMKVLSTDPELMKEFQDKSVALAQKMTAVSSGQ